MASSLITPPMHAAYAAALLDSVIPATAAKVLKRWAAGCDKTTNWLSMMVPDVPVKDEGANADYGQESRDYPKGKQSPENSRNHQTAGYCGYVPPARVSRPIATVLHLTSSPALWTGTVPQILENR